MFRFILFFITASSLLFSEFKYNHPEVDWQTFETGGMMITSLPGLESIVLKPGSATKPFFGIEAEIIKENKKNP